MFDIGLVRGPWEQLAHTLFLLLPGIDLEDVVCGFVVVLVLEYAN